MEHQPELQDTLPPLPADETTMADFVFGGIEADEGERLARERQRWSGLRHRYAIEPLDPQPDQPVTVTVFVGPDVRVEQVTLYFTTDGSDPVGKRGIAINGVALALHRQAVQWESLLWEYVERWQGEIPAQPAGTLVHYRIEGWCSNEGIGSHWSREPNLDRSVEWPTLYGYHVDDFAPPAWAYEAVLYQIFVDRFASGVQDTKYGIRQLPQRWLSPAELNDFAGGTLRGVIDHLDYIADLGVTALWLSPVFRTPTYHGYDTTDYYTVDPRFGTNADLAELVRTAHDRGLRIILDFVANHTSTEFAPFATARHNDNSPYRAWFSFDPGYTHGYRTFFNVAAMPQLNTDHPAVRRYLINAARYWLTEYDVDGYRLDYAAGPSHAFWSEFHAACRAAKPDCWLFGEATLAGEALRTYTGRLDGCLDFALCRLLRQLCARPRPAISLAQFVNEVERSGRFFGTHAPTPNFLLPSFLDNHDMNRFLWMAGNDQTRLRLAAGLLFALGGPPILYYGTEVGLSQPRPKGPWREEARHPMRWGDQQEQALLADFKGLIAARRRHPALWYGELATLHLNDDQSTWLFERRHGADQVLGAVNLGMQEQILSLPPGEFVDLAGGIQRTSLTLPGRSFTLMMPIAG
jgi:cyclomaltodextrinase / maltogenic alpha-amylase / neopullulanase